LGLLDNAMFLFPSVVAPLNVWTSINNFSNYCNSFLRGHTNKERRGFYFMNHAMVVLMAA
jgi:hypothetical protein